MAAMQTQTDLSRAVWHTSDQQLCIFTYAHTDLHTVSTSNKREGKVHQENP